jgi:TonB-dependent receptor
MSRRFEGTRARARTRLLLTASAAALCLGGQAFAQDAAGEAAEVEEVVVTGFRASLANALNIKRNEAGVVDAISAEDIADFPDTNLAESIQRIPGVSIDRDAGEGRSLTVRGLSSEFTRTRINGIEAQATTGATDSSGGTNRGRGFDFNVFASELFNNITVRKTASAEVEEGSLGATVDLRTSRPFDYKDFTAAASAQYGYNDLSEQWDPRFAALISDTWMDGKLGALLSVAYSERNLLEEGFSSVRWGPANGDNGFANPSALPGGAAAAGGIFHPRIPRYGRLVHEQERSGLTLSLQARPTDRTTITFDGLYSKLNSTRQENFLEAWSLSRNASQGGKPEVVIVNTEVDPNTGEMLYAQLNRMDMRTEQRFDVLKTDYSQFTLNIEHEFTDRLRLRALAGRSRSEFENPTQTTIIIDRQNIDGYSWDFRGNRDLPLINYGFNVADPNAWRVVPPSTTAAPTVAPRSEVRLNPNGQTNVYDTVQADLTFDLNDTFTLKGGLNYKTFNSEGWGLRRTGSQDMPALPAGVTMEQITELLTGFGKGLDMPEGNATSWVVPDLNAVAELYKIYCNCDTGVPGGDFRLTGISNPDARGNFREIEEKDTGAYVQVDWDSELLSMPFRGNVGVRYVKTEVSALGYSSVSTTPVTADHDYTDTLPSLNISLEPREDLILRFAAAKVMSRPPLGNLVPSYTLSALNAPNPSASLGNIALEPYRANTFDVSVEWYFAPESLLSFAYFYKDIDTFIQTTQQSLTYNELTALNPGAFPAGLRPGDLLHVFSTPSNTPGGPLSGFEVSYQQPFTFLPGIFENLGAILNYTYVKSEIDYCTTASCAVIVTEDLVNLSPKAWNGTLYYDDGRLNARLSAAYRDGYFQQVPAPNNGTRGIAANGKAESLTWDAAASFNLTDNVTLSVEALNLTDEPNHQWHGEVDRIRQSTYVHHHTGRQFYVGARYKF